MISINVDQNNREAVLINKVTHATKDSTTTIETICTEKVYVIFN